jgi:hypothetical protein
MSSVQFTGVENIIEAFEANDIPYFAVFAGKSLIFKNPTRGEEAIQDTFEASELLRSWLYKLNKGSNAVYTLKLYENIPAGGITDKTPANFSINFRLNLEGMYMTADKAVQYEQKQNQQSEILAELKALRMKVETMEGTDDDDEEEEINPIIGALTKNPELMNTIVMAAVSAITGMLGQFAVQKPIIMKPAINGVTDEPTEQQKIDKAIEVLSQSTPNLGDSLLILAKMSIDNPQQYKWLLGMLK